MKRFINFAALTVLIFFASIGIGCAHSEHGHSDHGYKAPKRTGILLVAFGSSQASAQVSFENIEKKVEAAYPDVPIRWAFTSHIIREKLAKQGRILDSPAVALAKMQDEKFTHVAVQSLHTIGGAEFHDLMSIVNGFEVMSGGFEKVLVGYPLLATAHDLEAVRDAMLDNIPGERKTNEAVILMGHGTHHPSNAFYQAMAYEFQRKDPNVYVGTVEGMPSLNDIMVDLKAKGTKKAWLIPFMSVAGDHVLNDMAGDEPESWKSILTKEGIEPKPVLKGTAEFDNIVDIYVSHLKKAFSHFEKH